MLRSVSDKDLTTRRPATAFPMNVQWVAADVAYPTAALTRVMYW